MNRRIAHLRSRLPLAVQGWLPDVPPPTTRNLWLVLAFLVAFQNCWVLQMSQGSADSILGLLLWGGALICIEDQLEEMRPQPGWLGMSFGTFLLLWVLSRTAVILGMDGVIFVLAPLAGLALALLCCPVVCIGRFKDALLCLLMLPLSKMLALWIIPEMALSEFTATVSAFWLSILGLDVLSDGRKVILPSGAVSVAGPCNGIEIITMLVCIAAIFLLAFPVRSNTSRVLLILFAPIIGLISNTTRIALLTILVSVGPAKQNFWFDFFHQQEGSLVFSAIAVFAYGSLYMRFLERELPPIHDSILNQEGQP